MFGEALGFDMGAFRPGSSVGMSVRLKSGRSPVRSRPWPPRFMQLNGYFSPGFEPRICGSGRRWGQYGAKTELPPAARFSDVRTQILERIECSRDVVEFVVEKVCVGVCGDGNRRVAHGLLEQAEIGTRAA